MTSSAVEDVWRREAPHVLAALLRRHGDFAACEDAVQDALVAASQQWPTDGLPDRPRGWLVTVAGRRLIDHERRESARRRREERAALDPLTGSLAGGPVESPDPLAATRLDDTLHLLVLCAHPALRPASQVALTLRAVAGLTTAQIAAAFLVSSNEFIDSMAKKYMDVDAYPFHQPGDERVVMHVEPEHTTQMGA